MSSIYDVFGNSTMYKQGELGMINECLLSIGETAYPPGTLPDVIQPGSDGDVARRFVASTMVEVQSRGWWFNTDYDFVFKADSGVGLPGDTRGGFVAVPANLLRIDVGNTEFKHRYILKDGLIYDLLEQDFVRDIDVVADAIWLVDYEVLPYTAYNYISARASRKFQQRVIGSTELYQFTAAEEQDAYTSLLREQLQYNDYTLLNPIVTNRLNNGNIKQGLYKIVQRRQF
jgi:hypothetical protein